MVGGFHRKGSVKVLFYFPTLTLLRKFWELLETRARCSLFWWGGVLQSLTTQLCGIFAQIATQGFPRPASALALIVGPTLEPSPAFLVLGNRSLSRDQQEAHPWRM